MAENYKGHLQMHSAFPRIDQSNEPDDGTKGPTKAAVAAESDWTVRMEGANRNKGDRY